MCVECSDGFIDRRSFMIALKGKPDIGDKINTQIIQPLIEANDRLAGAGPSNDYPC